MKKWITLSDCILISVSSILSWSINASIGWAIFHAMIAMVYVPYWLIKYSCLVNWVRNYFVC